MDCAFSAAEHAMAEEQSPRILDSSGMARAKQETLIAHVSFQHLQEPGVSVFRGSDTGFVAAGSRSGANEDEEDTSSSEDEDINEGTPIEDADKPGHSNNPLGTDTADTMQLLLHSPPNQTNGQTASSSKEDHFRRIPSQPLVDEDSDAASVNTEAETDPANLTARKEQDIHGTSKASQCGPSTATAKQTPAANQQFLSSTDDAEETLDTPEYETHLEAQVEETLETPEDETRLETQVEETLETPEDETRLEAQVEERLETPEDETRLEAQVEETLETPEDETRLEAQVEERLETPEDETRLEAQVEETLETPTEEEPLAMPTEESLEAPAKVALDHSQELLLSDVADCSDLPVAYSTEGGLPYTLYYVDINPTDRDE